MNVMKPRTGRVTQASNLQYHLVITHLYIPPTHIVDFFLSSFMGPRLPSGSQNTH